MLLLGVGVEANEGVVAVNEGVVVVKEGAWSQGVTLDQPKTVCRMEVNEGVVAGLFGVDEECVRYRMMTVHQWYAIWNGVVAGDRVVLIAILGSTLANLG
jgi:hypothetical protein